MKNLLQIPLFNVSENHEIIETLINNQNIRIERIISTGQSSPQDFWYDQNEHEWVLLLKGNAELELEKQQKITLKPGDCINIPAHQKHRVAYTSNTEETIWLAVFYW